MRNSGVFRRYSRPSGPNSRHPPETLRVSGRTGVTWSLAVRDSRSGASSDPRGHDRNEDVARRLDTKSSAAGPSVHDEGVRLHPARLKMRIRPPSSTKSHPWPRRSSRARPGAERPVEVRSELVLDLRNRRERRSQRRRSAAVIEGPKSGVHRVGILQPLPLTIRPTSRGNPRMSGFSCLEPFWRCSKPPVWVNSASTRGWRLVSGVRWRPAPRRRPGFRGLGFRIGGPPRVGRRPLGRATTEAEDVRPFPRCGNRPRCLSRVCEA